MTCSHAELLCRWCGKAIAPPRDEAGAIVWGAGGLSVPRGLLALLKRRQRVYLSPLEERRMDAAAAYKAGHIAGKVYMLEWLLAEAEHA